MTATMVPMKMRALQRYSLKLQINRTPISNDMQNAVSNSLSCYAIFVWFDDSVAVNALGNWLYVIRTCSSLFSPTLKSLYLRSLKWGFFCFVFVFCTTFVFLLFIFFSLWFHCEFLFEFTFSRTVSQSLSLNFDDQTVCMRWWLFSDEYPIVNWGQWNRH